jgi:IS5 family transposase
VIQTRRLQRAFADGLISEEIEDLREPWMRHSDRVLQDDRLLEIVQKALAQRCRKSKTRGRPATTAEVVLRMLLLKHIFNCSYERLTREVRANLVYRDFAGIGAGKVPDDKTLGRLGRQLGPAVIEQIHQRVVELAREHKVVQGRKMRVDTTVVETNIHYPTDSTLLGDGVRVLIRIMRQARALLGTAAAKVRDCTRTVRRRMLQVSQASRDKTAQGHSKLRHAYEQLLAMAARVIRQAGRFSATVQAQIKRARGRRRTRLKKAHSQFAEMIPRLEQVIRQTRQRILEGDTHAENKLVSMFEATTEVIRKGKAGKPNEFGKLAKIQEAENQIITHYEVYDHRPSDSHLLTPSIAKHQQQFGRAPQLVAADAGFFSAANETAAEQMGVKRLAIPNRSTKSEARKQRQKSRWFRQAMKWRTGCEGRISVLKRRHGLNRCRYQGPAGMQRWVGLGVLADNIINIGRHLARRPA